MERLYVNGDFNTRADYCERFGHDLLTGAAVDPEKYRAADPMGRAFIKAADYQPPLERPDQEFPFFLTTGRIVYHWHTRTKTARTKELNRIAPEAFVEISPEDARESGIADGEEVQVESRRGMVQLPARIAEIHRGHLFIPFHYGYWDRPGHPRAANELTITEWDSVSKQPHFKYAEVRIRKMSGTIQPVSTAPMVEDLRAASEEPRPHSHVAPYLRLQYMNEEQLAYALLNVAQEHKKEPDIEEICGLLAAWSIEHVKTLKSLLPLYPVDPKDQTPEAKTLFSVLFHGPRQGGVGLLRDLEELWLLASQVHIGWTALDQAAKAKFDRRLEQICESLGQQTDRQRQWLQHRIKQASSMSLNMST
jgi:formylmethanofuran dehydrogenase subunit D